MALKVPLQVALPTPSIYKMQPLHLLLLLLSLPSSASGHSMNERAASYLRDHWWLCIIISITALVILIFCCFWVSDYGSMGCFCLHIHSDYDDGEYYDDDDLELAKVAAPTRVTNLTSKEIAESMKHNLPKGKSGVLKTGPAKAKKRESSNNGGGSGGSGVSKKRSTLQATKDKIQNTSVKIRGFSVYNALSVEKAPDKAQRSLLAQPSGVEDVTVNASGDVLWKQIFDEGSGHYYYQRNDGFVQWEAPNEPFHPASD